MKSILIQRNQRKKFQFLRIINTKYIDLKRIKI